MPRWILILALLPLATLASVGEAGGRWGVSYRSDSGLVAYVETIVSSVAWPQQTEDVEPPANENAGGPYGLVGAEVVAGFETFLGEATVLATPYSAVALYWPTFRLRFDINTPFEGRSRAFDFSWRISMGGSW